MKNFIPTYDQCREICDANDNFLFYEMKYIIDGFNISVFDYKLAYATQFINPIQGKDYDAHEMRGLMFVFNEDGSLFDRFLLLKKFFNINQCISTQLGTIKDYEIESVHEKLDGSVVSFIKLPNGKSVPRSKASFVSEMAKTAAELYDKDIELKTFIDEKLANNIIPIFEFVSPYNRVVIKYEKTELVLLQLRDNVTGEYLPLENIPTEIRTPIRYDLSLDEILAECEVLEDFEGYIIMFKNGLMCKKKTKWYFNVHGLFTEQLYRENDIIRLILNNEVDDVLSQLNDTDMNLKVDIIIKKLEKYITTELSNTKALLTKFTGDIPLFAKSYKKEKYFNLAMSDINNNTWGKAGGSEKQVIRNIRHITFYLENARTFLSEIQI